MSGTVAKIPIGGEYGVPPQLIPACVACPTPERLAIEAGQGSETPAVTGSALITLREACDEGTLNNPGAENGLVAARRASQRPGFPEIAGWRDGKTALYFRGDLIAYRDGKGRGRGRRAA